MDDIQHEGRDLSSFVSHPIILCIKLCHFRRQGGQPMRRFLSPIAAVIGCLAPVFPALSTATETSTVYHVTKTVSLGTPDRWDYIVFDPSTHQVYVSHDDRVNVVDGRDGTIVGTVEGMPGGTHGFGISVA